MLNLFQHLRSRLEIPKQVRDDKLSMDYNVALAHFPKITYARYKKLCAFFSDLKNLWETEIEDLVKAGLEENIAHEFLLWREQNPADSIAERLARENIKIVTINDANYPALLAEINDPPLALFYRGILPGDEDPTIAVVGTRRHTLYGKQTCMEISGDLARNNLIVVSGLALGLDGIAHQAVIDNKGRTLAVLGSGVDDSHVYPASHRYLAQKIIETGGAIISEYPPGFLPTQYSFPARNRIIAGLSLGTLVIEAPEESGSLITARCALDYNREVFAVPHPISSPVGTGCNNLLKSGAKLVTSAQDILESFNLKNLTETITKKQMTFFEPNEQKIYSTLSKEPKHIDEITKAIGIDSRTVSSTLTLLELRGAIKNLGNMMYVVS